MRKVREILRLQLRCKLGVCEIARSCSISHSTAGEYLGRAEKTGLSWAEIEKMDDEQLKRSMITVREILPLAPRPQPDWNYIHQGLRKKGVTLQLLWEEYQEFLLT